VIPDNLITTQHIPTLLFGEPVAQASSQFKLAQKQVNKFIPASVQSVQVGFSAVEGR
jgi:hypothetical protein